MLLETQVNNIEQLMKQGNTCLAQKKWQQALLNFNSVVLLDPEHIEALKSCANSLIHLNRSAEATLYSQRALQLNLDCNTLTLHAAALYKIGKYTEALNCFDRIIESEPNHYSAMNQRALCLTQINRYDEAQNTYQQALTHDQDPWIRYNYSLCLLAMGNLLHGFTLYEYRWLCPLLEKRRAWNMPELANAEMLRGKSILIHSEQGLGDSIQFFRYIPLLVQLGARVFLEIQPALIPLFHSWRHTIHFIATGAPLPSCDFHYPLMSLPKWFKTEMQTIPKSIPYVFPDMPALEACQKKLGDSKHKRVGIAWKGSASNSMNQKRSIALNTLLTLHQSNIDFICLQQDVYLEEKKELDQHNIPYHSLELSTMAGTAALIACLDLVITVDTSIAHLAAAMGKETWILLPFSADWRWFLEREDSPWYPNVKLFRQETSGDWRAPLSRIKNRLIALQPADTSNIVTIPTSTGDLIDRITILQLKLNRIKNENQLKHVKIELNLLIAEYNKIKKSLSSHSEMDKLENQLMNTNTQLWDLEDQIRQPLEDIDIAKTAKEIIKTNDLRSSIKYKINSLLNSTIVEEKSYSHQPLSNTVT